MIRLPTISPQLRLAFAIAPWLIAAGLLAALLVAGARHDISKARHAASYQKLTSDAARVTAAAQVLDLAHARQVERDQATITEGATRDLEEKLARARADAAAYARRLRDHAAAQGGGRSARVPGPAEPAAPAARPVGAAELDADLRICAEAVTKAQGWQNWRRKMEAVER